VVIREDFDQTYVNKSEWDVEMIQKFRDLKKHLFVQEHQLNLEFKNFKIQQ